MYDARDFLSYMGVLFHESSCLLIKGNKGMIWFQLEIRGKIQVINTPYKYSYLLTHIVKVKLCFNSISTCSKNSCQCITNYGIASTTNMKGASGICGGMFQNQSGIAWRMMTIGIALLLYEAQCYLTKFFVIDKKIYISIFCLCFFNPWWFGEYANKRRSKRRRILLGQFSKWKTGKGNICHPSRRSFKKFLNINLMGAMVDRQWWCQKKGHCFLETSKRIMHAQRICYL